MFYFSNHGIRISLASGVPNLGIRNTKKEGFTLNSDTALTVYNNSNSDTALTVYNNSNSDPALTVYNNSNSDTALTVYNNSNSDPAQSLRQTLLYLYIRASDIRTKYMYPYYCYLKDNYNLYGLTKGCSN